MTIIRSLRESDGDFVLQMTQHESLWNLPCDMRRCMEFASEGRFVTEVDGKQASHR